MARRQLLLCVGLGAAVFLWPDVAALRQAASPGRWLATSGADAVAATVAGALLWCCAVWLLGALALMSLAGRSGWCGRVAARMVRVVVPRVLLRVLAGGAGIAVGLAPIAAGVPAPAAAATPAAVAATDRPPAPGWPASTRPPPAPASRNTHPRHGPEPPPSRARQVVVRPGDCLWRIAARALPRGAPDARIAREWPRWWAANRSVIGPDPDVIRPGERLTAPPTASGHRAAPAAKGGLP